MKFDFKSSDNIYLFNSKIETQRLSEELKKLALKSHVFILSSGTTQKGTLKGYALSKKSILSNAQAVNKHLSLTKDDIWLLSLPYYHVGGLSIYARASLNQAKIKVYNDNWNPKSFVNSLEGCTVCSVVPLQCYDIVKYKLYAPRSLRYLIVGGDYLPNSIHQELIKLNWPVIRTYGMTEVCSQLATETSTSEKPKLKILDIHKISLKGDRVEIDSPALYTGEFKFSDEFIYSPRQTNTFVPQDILQVDGESITPLGRADSDIKIKGRRVDFSGLQRDFQELAVSFGIYKNVILRKVEDLRDGYHLYIDYDLDSEPIDFISSLHDSIAPLRIQKVSKVLSIGRTELGKIKTE